MFSHNGFWEGHGLHAASVRYASLALAPEVG